MKKEVHQHLIVVRYGEASSLTFINWGVWLLIVNLLEIYKRRRTFSIPNCQLTLAIMPSLVLETNVKVAKYDSVYRVGPVR
jgi:hypothetical protein